jgi:hypothetical protein
MAQTQMPPATGVNHTTVLLNAVEVLITFGHTRLGIVNDNGVAATEAYVEWLHTASLSPTAALQLCDKLSEVLMAYAQRYGPIPKDQDLISRSQPAGGAPTAQ